MKSSWKKQRLATKKRSIKLMKWKNNFMRKYGFKRIADFGVRASEAARKVVDAFYSIRKSIRELQKANEVME
ncbi:hypothetical protein [Lactococcus garvieae]|uniref:hypothetical protein n=1 Tax=Lactococcus garvieae TaxID=1363 RepID=UPI003857C904